MLNVSMEASLMLLDIWLYVGPLSDYSHLCPFQIYFMQQGMFQSFIWYGKISWSEVVMVKDDGELTVKLT